MIFINNPQHPSAQQIGPSRDMPEQFGVGTAKQKDTGAGMVERSMQVQITNPGMRAAHGKPVREEAQRLTARSMDVMVRSGNQVPDQVDGTLPRSLAWGQAGVGDPIAIPSPMPFLMLVVGVGVAAFLLMRRA